MKHVPFTPFATHLSSSAKEIDLRVRSIFHPFKKKPPSGSLFLIILAALSCGGLVSCQPVQPVAPQVSVPSSDSTSEAPSDPNLKKDQIVEQTLTGLTLDESGAKDDSIHVRSDPFQSHQLALTVTLGNGQILEKVWDEGNLLPHAFTAPLIDPDREAIVLDCSVFGSNYGGAMVLVADVAQGQIVERYNSGWDPDLSFQQGCIPLIAETESTASLRLPCMVDKWHNPEYYTLTWDDQSFQVVGDGYFVDREAIPVSSHRELTLALRGIRESTGDLVYTQVQVIEDDALLQTINPDFYLPQEHYEHSGFLADSLKIADINFDGASDFGLLCDTTVNKVHAWFIWDESQNQFRYLAHLGGNLELKEQEKQFVVQFYDESADLYRPQVYTYDNAGQLIPNSRQIPAAQLPSIFQTVLQGSRSFYDTESQQTLDINQIGQAMTPDDTLFQIINFAIVDMDGDNRFELVLEITSPNAPGNGGFLILREHLWSIYGYTLWYRAFNALKADGTFSFSSSAFSSGFGRLSFRDDGYDKKVIALSDILQDQPDHLVFYLEGSPVSESTFDTAILQQDKKPDAVWHPFTQDNISNLAALAADLGFPNT